MPSPIPVTPVRTSARGRIPSKKYSVEELTGFDVLSSASEEDFEAWGQLAESDDDDEFDEAQGIEEANEPEDDESSSSGEESDGSGIITPVENDLLDDELAEADDLAGHTQENGPSLPRQSLSYSHLYRPRKAQEPGTHIRGIADPISAKAKGAKADYVYCLFGSAAKDLVHVARSRDQWAHSSTLPRRPNKDGSRGMKHFFSYTEEDLQLEAKVGWDWYYIHGGRRYMSSLQQTHGIPPAEALKYIPQPLQRHRTLFMGPYGRQTRFDLPFLQSLATNEGSRHAAEANGSPIDDPGQSNKAKVRDGWMLNVGTGVRCLDWAPNQSGDRQYLALSTFQLESNEKFGESSFSPAFTPQSFPSSIQLWSFSSSATSDRESLLDPDWPPCLSLVICTDWGDAKHLQWCPFPRNFREEDYEEGKIPIGLLAGVWSDGHVRVLDISLKHTESHDTQYIHYTTAAFTAKPPTTLSTCLAWLSPTDLAVGHANGFLALYSIYPHPSPHPHQPLPTPTYPLAQPYLYHPLHTTYILSLCTAHPLSPHLLASSSSSGHVRLTDLRAPHTDTVTSASRIRIAPTIIKFSEPTHAFITVDEDNVKLWPLRRFYSPMTVARLGGGGGMSLDTGSFHSSIVVGGVDGSVSVTNPMLKLLWPKKKAWKCEVFRHEFARSSTTQTTASQDGRASGGERASSDSPGNTGYNNSTGTNINEADHEPTTGKIRILTSFRASELGGENPQRSNNRSSKVVEGVVVATIYEEEGQARCVAWGKGCVGVSGWMASGMGSGLVRVEDCGV